MSENPKPKTAPAAAEEAAGESEGDEGRELEERELGADTEATPEPELHPEPVDGEPGKGMVLARATVHLPGLGFGDRAYVDPKIPYVDNAFKQGFLVRVDQDGE